MYLNENRYLCLPSQLPLARSYNQGRIPALRTPLRICRVSVFNMVKNFFAKQTFRRNKNLGTWGSCGASVKLGNTSGLPLWWRNELLIAAYSGVSRCQWFCQRSWKNCLFLWMLSTSWEPGLTHCYFKRFCQEMRGEEQVHCCNTEVN